MSRTDTTSQQPRFTSTITQQIGFRGGHVVSNPHVHDFTVKVTASQHVALTGDQTGMGVDVLALRKIIVDEVAAVLGHRMSVWVDEPAHVVARPCDWPKDIAGPDMPILHWAVRPTVENLRRWIASRVISSARAQCPHAQITEVEVAETARTSVVLGREALNLLEAAGRTPGPLELEEPAPEVLQHR